MDFRKRLWQNAATNFLRFNNGLTSSTTEKVFNSAYKIYSYDLMCNFLAEDLIPFEHIEFLVSKNDTVLDFLWDRLNQTIYSAENHDELCQLVRELYDESLKGEADAHKLSYREKLSQNAAAEYQNYLAKEMQKSKDEIIYNAYEISVYDAFHEFLTDICNTEMEEQVCKNLCADGESILEKLFHEFSTTSQVSINSYNDVYDFLLQYSSYYFSNGESDNQRRDKLIGTLMISKLKEFSNNFAEQQSNHWDKESIDNITMEICNYFYMHESASTEINDYLHARLAVNKATIQFLNEDLSYACGTDGLINYYCLEEELLSNFIKENPSKSGNTVFEKLNTSYIESIYSHAKTYGFTRQMIADELDKKIAKLSASSEM